MYRAGAVTSVKAEIVYANDTYDFDEETMDRPRHTRERFASKAVRGRMVGVYAYAVMRNGALSRVIEMGEEEVMEHKAASKTGNGADSPWVKWPRSMWLKTAVHELAKWVPTSNEYLTDQARAQGEMLRHANKPTSAPPSGPTPPAMGGDEPGRDEPVRVAAEQGSVVDGTVVEQTGERMVTEAQMRAVHASFRTAGITDEVGKRAYATEKLGFPVESLTQLSTRQASQLIDALKREPADGGS
jgi:hypothetical protein